MAGIIGDCGVAAFSLGAELRKSNSSDLKSMLLKEVRKAKEASPMSGMTSASSLNSLFIL